MQGIVVSLVSVTFL